MMQACGRVDGVMVSESQCVRSYVGSDSYSCSQIKWGTLYSSRLQIVAFGQRWGVQKVEEYQKNPVSLFID